MLQLVVALTARRDSRVSIGGTFVPRVHTRGASVLPEASRHGAVVQDDRRPHLAASAPSAGRAASPLQPSPALWALWRWCRTLGE